MCLLDLFQGVGGGWGAVETEYVFFGEMLVGRFKCRKMGVTIKIRNSFMNNSVEALIVILFNEGHQGMLKRHAPLGWVGFSCVCMCVCVCVVLCVCVEGGWEMGLSPKEGMFFETKK